MKIYFSGALRASSNNWHTYGQMIGYIKGKYGEVLTQHYKYGAFTISKDHEMRDEEIFQYYMELLRQCDVVIQEVSLPSLGVGFEAAKAIELGKPVLCLYNGQVSKLSALIAGNKALTVKHYENLDEALKEIDAFIAKVSISKKAGQRNVLAKKLRV